MTIIGTAPSIQVDIRTKAGDPKTTLTATSKSLNADGTISLVVPNEDRMGEAALIVILNSDGTVIKQVSTIIGG